MADAATTSGIGTDLVPYAEPVEALRPVAQVQHDTSYVTQLLANAADLPNMPLRRRSDRVGPLAAYAAPQITRIGRTRLIA